MIYSWGTERRLNAYGDYFRKHFFDDHIHVAVMAHIWGDGVSTKEGADYIHWLDIL